MASEIETLDAESLLHYTHWILETGLWNGRSITWKEAPAFQREIEERILTLLCSNDPSNPHFEKLAAQLAWIGSPQQNHILLAREIEELHLSPTILQASFWKKTKHFWKEHKKEILIGAAIVAVVAATIIVVACSGGAAAGVAVGAGGVALKQATDEEEKDKPYPKASNPPQPPPSSPTLSPVSTPPPPLSQIPPSLPLPKNIQIRIFLRNAKGLDVPPGDLSVISAINASLEYEIDDPKTTLLKTIHKETYEEALSKTRKQNPVVPRCNSLESRDHRV